MKKTLIALAVMTVSGAAFAQSSVTMYGVIDVAYGSHKTTNLDGTVTRKSSGIMDGNNAGNRIGFRGTEDLGGGLKANFVIEQGINPTSGDGFNKRVSTSHHQVDGTTAYSTGNSRQAYVGASGGFGEVRAGYQYTNSYDLVAFNGLSRSEFHGGVFQNGTSSLTTLAVQPPVPASTVSIGRGWVFTDSQATSPRANLLQEVVCIAPEAGPVCKENPTFNGLFVVLTQQQG